MRALVGSGSNNHFHESEMALLFFPRRRRWSVAENHLDTADLVIDGAPALEKNLRDANKKLDELKKAGVI